MRNGVTPMFGTGPNLGMSPGVWGNCPFSKLRDDIGSGWLHVERWFDKTHSYASATAANGYLTYQDTGVTIANAVITETELNDGDYKGLIGYLQIAGLDADCDEGNIQWGSGVSNMFCFDTGLGKAWFETCMRFQSITECSYFVGLADQAAAAADFMADTSHGIASDEDVIGFRTLIADTDGLDAIYQTASATQAVVDEESAVIVASSTTGWYRLALSFDGDSTMYWYVDGVCVGSVDVETTGFPDGVGMAPFWATKSDTSSTTEHKVDIAWWAGAQLF